jgi:hypothetical protein
MPIDQNPCRAAQVRHCSDVNFWKKVPLSESPQTGKNEILILANGVSTGRGKLDAFIGGSVRYSRGSSLRFSNKAFGYDRNDTGIYREYILRQCGEVWGSTNTSPSSGLGANEKSFSHSCHLGSKTLVF